MKPEILEFIKPFQRHKSDNGSPEVQIAILTWEILDLQKHLEKHIHDVDAKRALLKKVARRRKYLRYLKSHDLERYTLVAKKLKLKA